MTYDSKLVRVFASIADLLGLSVDRADEGKETLRLVPGTRVYLSPPERFSEAPNFSGYQCPEHQSSILVNEMPAPFADASRGMDADNLATRGIKLISKQSVEVSGLNGLLLCVQQKAFKVFHRKWIAMFGNSHDTVMIMATFPEENELLGEQLKRCVMDVMWDPQASIDPLADMTFVVHPPEGMRLAHRMQMMLVYTSDGQVDHPSPRDPIFVIGQSVGKEDIPDVRTFSRARILKTEGYFHFEVKRERPVTVDGMEGYELDADATDAKSGERVAIYQLVLPSRSDGTYFIAQGIIHGELTAQYLPKFERSAHSLLRR